VQYADRQLQLKEGAQRWLGLHWLCCAALCCVALRSAVLRSAVLRSAVLRSALLCCAPLCCAALRSAVLRSALLCHLLGGRLAPYLLLPQMGAVTPAEAVCMKHANGRVTPAMGGSWALQELGGWRAIPQGSRQHHTRLFHACGRLRASLGQVKGWPVTLSRA
jgi:hypothetical protein